MKNLAHPSGLTLLAAFLSLTASGGAWGGASAAADIHALSGSASQRPARIYRFPGGGVRNANRYIGPFCCTGETATIAGLSGRPAGYIYFYDFTGGLNIAPNRSTAATISILVNGVTPGRPVISRATFDAASWRPGASRTLRSGNLTFEVTLQAEIIEVAGARAFEMRSVRATVRVIGA